MILDLSWTLLLVYVVTATLTYLFFHSRKAIYKSPLRQLPGPWYSTFTELWLIFQEFSGNRRSYIHKLHEKFGSVIRLGPSEVSFTSADAVREIYTNGGSGYDKTELYTMFMQFGVRTMFSTLSKAGVGTTLFWNSELEKLLRLFLAQSKETPYCGFIF